VSIARLADHVPCQGASKKTEKENKEQKNNSGKKQPTDLILREIVPMF
jgi:hypothetical protein